MEVSVIVSIYKDIAALQLILKSLAGQSFKGNFEVIIAEDNDSSELPVLIENWCKCYSFRIEHVSQQDKGFRKCTILNKAVLKSSAPYLIFIDGDCLLHHKFIEAHLSHRQNQTVVYGRRVMLSEKFAESVRKSRKVAGFSFLKLWASGSSRLDVALYLPCLKPKNKKGLWGHNWSVHKKDLLAVKGFDEHYTQAGIGEDTDIEWRMEQMGYTFCRIKNKAIQYHLWHSVHYADTFTVESILNVKKDEWNISRRQELLWGSIEI